MRTAQDLPSVCIVVGMNGAAGNSPAVQPPPYYLLLVCCARDICSARAAQRPPSAETPARCQGLWVLPARCVLGVVWDFSLRVDKTPPLDFRSGRAEKSVGNERKEPLSFSGISFK